MILAWARRVGVRFFIDLGGYDGETFSNTAALADGGCGGWVIDASPDAAAKAAIRYAGSPVFVAVGAFDLDYETRGYPFPLQWSPDEPFSDGADTCEAARTLIHVAPLPLDWLDELIAGCPRPLLVSIDMEGSTLACLEWLLKRDDPPELVVVETNDDDAHLWATGLAQGRYLELGRTQVNTILERRDG